MKGIIFTEFLKMVEAVFSAEIADQIIRECNLSTGGAYTTVGTYDHHELLKMVTRLSEISGVSVSELEVAYGRYLFSSFTQHYSKLIANAHTSFELLTSINDYIHVEVRKLYPDAELPTFYHQVIDSQNLILEYHSMRPLSSLAKGLILGCADYFKEKIEVQEEVLPGSDRENIVRFSLKRSDT